MRLLLNHFPSRWFSRHIKEALSRLSSPEKRFFFCFCCCDAFCRGRAIHSLIPRSRYPLSPDRWTETSGFQLQPGSCFRHAVPGPRGTLLPPDTLYRPQFRGRHRSAGSFAASPNIFRSPQAANVPRLSLRRAHAAFSAGSRGPSPPRGSGTTQGPPASRCSFPPTAPRPRRRQLGHSPDAFLPAAVLFSICPPDVFPLQKRRAQGRGAQTAVCAFPVLPLHPGPAFLCRALWAVGKAAADPVRPRPGGGFFCPDGSCPRSLPQTPSWWVCRSGCKRCSRNNRAAPRCRRAPRPR